MPRGEHNRSDRDRDHERRQLRAEETGSQEILDEGIIQVQVIPQDDNWGETATSITETATSIVTLSETDLSDVVKERRRFSCVNFSRHVKIVPEAFLSMFAVISPILFVVFPVVTWKPTPCGTNCDGLFISFAVKELLLVIGIWALYFRMSRVTLPRVFVLRVGVMVLVFLVLVCYWLFYGLRIIEKKTEQFVDILHFAVTLTDTLLFLHYASLVVLWIRQTDPLFTLKVIRSTDGVSRFYNIGPLSIQRTAVFVLEQYYKDFPEYNPYLTQTPARSSHKQFSSLKFYDIDGKQNDKVNPRAKAILTAASTRRRDPARNDRFYEEAEFDRKVKRRKARLSNACEEAFGHIKRVQLERGPCVPMDPEETAQSLFPSFARPLQKYLRTVRLHHRFTMDGIIKHLAHCLTFDMTPKAFLERYMNDQPCVEFTTKKRTQTWSIVCEEQVTKSLSSSTVFQLKSEDISLVVTIRKLPYFDISEDEFDFESNKFVLRLNSETSV
ncbi:Vang-like protein 1 [Desmophyllum pertusum]|uniref:Vang-like protein n=1 Tax=Desmophyllum pertusum TaxID=174260 RepID=A0A9W9YBZ3_9CNID|nr:Vang-like protein 1 [Desmophyllum pertusum]